MNTIQCHCRQNRLEMQVTVSKYVWKKMTRQLSPHREKGVNKFRNLAIRILALRRFVLKFLLISISKSRFVSHNILSVKLHAMQEFDRSPSQTRTPSYLKAQERENALYFSLQLAESLFIHKLTLQIHNGILIRFVMVFGKMR